MRKFLFTVPFVEQIEQRMLLRHETQEEVRKHLAEHPTHIELPAIIADNEEEAMKQALKDYDDMGYFPHTEYV